MWNGALVYRMPMSNSSKIVFSLCLGAVLCYWYQSQQPGEQTGPFVAFLDVGQGDATYIRTASGQDVLIDGGPSRAILEQLPKVMAAGDTTIEVLMLSHPDADHITGLVEVAQRYSVKQIITTALPATKSLHLELEQLIQEKQIEHVLVFAGDVVQFDDSSEMNILYPAISDDLLSLETNDASMIGEYHFHDTTSDTSILFTGDASDEVEAVLLQRDLLHDVDILKVGHHGSKTSSSDDFLSAITPEVCVIEVAKDNAYGHPTTETLERLKPYCTVHRTDQEGNVIWKL